MILKVRVSTVAAEAAQSQWPTIPSSRAAAYRGETPDMAQDTRDSLAGPLPSVISVPSVAMLFLPPKVNPWTFIHSSSTSPSRS